MYWKYLGSNCGGDIIKGLCGDEKTSGDEGTRTFCDGGGVRGARVDWGVEGPVVAPCVSDVEVSDAKALNFLFFGVEEAESASVVVVVVVGAAPRPATFITMWSRLT